MLKLSAMEVVDMGADVLLQIHVNAKVDTPAKIAKKVQKSNMSVAKYIFININ